MNSVQSMVAVGGRRRLLFFSGLFVVRSQYHRQIFSLTKTHHQNTHSLYIRVVRYQYMFSDLVNRFKLVYGPFGQRKMTCTLVFCQDQLGRN